MRTLIPFIVALFLLTPIPTLAVIAATTIRPLGSVEKRICFGQEV
jgi:hypothetical protein